MIAKTTINAENKQMNEHQWLEPANERLLKKQILLPMIAGNKHEC